MIWHLALPYGHAYSAGLLKLTNIGYDNMVMRSLRDGASGGFMKYILFGLLGMSVGGLVVMDVRGVLSGGSVGSNDVARVGDYDIGLRDFDRAFRNAISQYNISTQQAYQAGFHREVLNAQVQRGFLINEAKNMGMSVPQDYLAKYIAKVVKPQAREGQSLQEALDEILRFRQITEQDFVRNVKDEVLSEILVDAMRDGAKPEFKYLAEDLRTFQDQSRTLEMIVFPSAEIESVEPPTDEQLKRLYESVKNTRYKLPEYRAAEIVSLDIESVPIDVDVSEEDVKEFYDENPKAFEIGEQYILTQSLLETEEQANKVYALTQQGTPLKEATQEVVKQGSRHFEKTPFEKSAMIAELAAVISEETIGQVLEPVKTTLGYHVVILDEIIPPTIPPFEQVSERIRQGMLQEKRQDELYKVAQRFEEIISDGTPLGQIEQQMSVVRQKIPLVTSDGLPTPEQTNNSEKENGEAQEAADTQQNPMLQFPEQDRELILEILFSLTPQDSVLVEELPSGSFSAVVLTETVQQSFKPFELVKEELEQSFIGDLKKDANKEKVGKFLAEIEAGGSTLQSISKETGKKIKTLEDVKLGGALPQPLISQNLPIIFKAELNGHDYIEIPGAFAIIKIAGYSLGNDPSGQVSDIKVIQEQVDKEATEEAFLAYLKGLSVKYDATINERLLSQAYGGSQ